MLGGARGQAQEGRQNQVLLPQQTALVFGPATLSFGNKLKKLCGRKAEQGESCGVALSLPPYRMPLSPDTLRAREEADFSVGRPRGRGVLWA